MNHNMLVSTALISSLWENNKKDILDLLLPFLKYSIAKTAGLNQKLDIDKVIKVFKSEFGYSSIPRNVITIMLNRLSPEILRKKKDSYTLVASLDEELASFEKKRTIYRDRKNQVGNALSAYINDNVSGLKEPFTIEKALTALIDFFVVNGLVVARAPEQLSLISKARDGKIEYCIARFLVDESKQESATFDYILDMVKGFFVSTAISFQPENLSVTHSKFKNLRCYLDTRVIINALGLRLPTARDAALELLSMLRDEQAIICCFEHTVKEIRDILKAYKSSLLNPQRNTVHNTLERWDEMYYSVTDVDRYISTLSRKIEALGVEIVPESGDDRVSSEVVNEIRLKEELKARIQYGTNNALTYDVLSISKIMQLRGNYSTIELEKCKHIFVTTNIPLIAVTKEFLNIQSSSIVPPMIADVDLSAIVWLKCGNSHRDYPKQKLLENALLALEPNHTLLKTFFDVIDRLKAEGGLTEDEAAIIRSDIYIKRELVHTSNGDEANISVDTVYTIRDRLRQQYIGDADEKAEANFRQYVAQRDKNSEVLRKAIAEIERVGEETSNTVKTDLQFAVKVAMFVAFVLLTIFIVVDFINGKFYWIGAVILVIVDIYGAFDLTFGKQQFINNLINRRAGEVAAEAREKKRAEYSAILGDLDSMLL